MRPDVRPDSAYGFSAGEDPAESRCQSAARQVGAQQAMEIACEATVAIGHARHAHMAHDHKKQVQQDIDQAGDRPDGTADASYRPRREGSTRRRYGACSAGIPRKSICVYSVALSMTSSGLPMRVEQGTCQREAQHAHQHAADARHDDGGMHALMHGAGSRLRRRPGQ